MSEGSVPADEADDLDLDARRQKHTEEQEVIEAKLEVVDPKRTH